MKIILKENIENLGNKGDIVKVAAGYGRNYLLPKKLALEVTSTNMKMIEIEQASLKKNLEKARVSYQDVIQRLNDVSLSFERKAGEKDTIFGSVSVADIKEALDLLSFEIEKKKILLKEPIKRLGNFTVPIKVFLDDIAEIKIQVVSESREEEEVKPVVDKAKAETKTRKKQVETVPQEDIVKAASEEHEEAPKEELVPAESKEADKPEEEKGEVVEEEKKTKEEPAAAPNAEALKDEEKDNSSEKSKAIKE
ncbi:MAG: 50S ribosomal protein L9 [Candidatus Aminicenantes bacterium]|nr:50S ribosomal protein L9 [Candidatus Aminicenantes bacterium]